MKHFYDGFPTVQFEVNHLPDRCYHLHNEQRDKNVRNISIIPINIIYNINQQYHSHSYLPIHVVTSIPH